MRTDLVFGMAGSGGDGIVSAGESLIAAAAAEGYHAIMTKSFGSQIRGGESSCRVRVATTEVLNPGGVLDVAVALNWDDFLKFGAELPGRRLDGGDLRRAHGRATRRAAARGRDAQAGPSRSPSRTSPASTRATSARRTA